MKLGADIIASRLALGAFDAEAADAASTLNGLWKFERTGEVLDFQPCQGGVCETLVGLPPAAVTMRDIHNPDRTRRGRPLCGLMVIYNLKVAGADQRRGGSAYAPDDGKTYGVRIDRVGSDLVELKAYLSSLPWLGETYRLHPSGPVHCP